MLPSPLSRIYEHASPTWTIGLLACLTVFYVLIGYIISYQRLRHVPGPPLAAWTNLWWINAVLSKRGHLYLYDALKEYGSLVRIAPNTLVTSDTDFVRKINAVRSPYQRSDWNKAFRFDADRDNAFSETDAEKHAKLKSKLSPGYSGKENPNLESDMDKVIMTFVELMKSKYISKSNVLRPVDIGEKIHFLTLDIITSLSTGTPFGWLTDDEDKYSYIATIAASVPAMSFMGAVPFLSRLTRMPAFQRLVLPSVKDRIGMGAVKGVAHKIIAQRLSETRDQKGIQRKDMLQSMINHCLTEGEIADDFLLQILAGSDTSGVILRSALIYLVSNPRIYNRLKSEVTSTDVPLDSIISHARAQQLPYLSAVIKETLRFYPINTGLSPKTVGPDGDFYNGLALPPGTEIGVSAWALYRHNPAYGEDCGHYRPERWLEARPEQLARMEREHDLVFASGRFRCLGERITRMELSKCLFEMMKRFEFAFLDPLKLLEKEENHGLWVQRGLWARVEEVDART